MSRILMSYAPHMLRDYLVTRGGAMAVVAAVFVGPLLLAFRDLIDPDPEQLIGQARSVITSLTPFLTLIAAYGLIGQDFRQGYYRPMFAKPISVPLYYALLFCCATLSFWIVHGLILLAFATFGVNAWSPATWLDLTLRFSLLGTLTFAISRVTRLDWILAVFLFTLASPLRNSYPAAESIRGWLINVMFPPTQLFNLAPELRAQGQLSALIGPAGTDWGSIAWVAGYSAICFGIGLWAVRRIPLASVQ
jgi:ABC-type transport system involved in multi-copper enzyme maturation permease subunit